MPRKTIAITTLREIVNRRNRKSSCDPNVRAGWNSLIEEALLATGNYHGFGYLSERDLPAGTTPGVRCGDDYAERFRETDDTRRIYY